MNRIDRYRETLRGLDDWDPFLLEHSGLPGPRGNLELAQAAADEGTEDQFLHFLTLDAAQAPTNSPGEFLAFCGVVGLGRLVAEGRREYLSTLRRYASDPRWRIREAVAMALQRLGQVDMAALLEEMAAWSRGNFLEQRAAAAALCEPKLLRDRAQVEQVLRMLDEITASILKAEDRKSDGFRALRKGLGYCWSVAVVALPSVGKPMLERWLLVEDRDVRWIVRQNLGKNRLLRMDAGWVQASRDRLG